MKASKHRIYSKALFIIILTAALFYFNPGDTLGFVPGVMNQNYPLIMDNGAHRIQSVHLSKDMYIAKDSESNDNQNDDDDDDWEA